MKFPFVNRHRYVEIKAYTSIKWYVDEIPLVLTKDVKPTHLNSKQLSPEEKRYARTFNSCQGRIAGLRNSITIRNHCEYDILANTEEWTAVVPNGNEVFQIESVHDHVFRPKDVNVAKVSCPWLIETNNSDVHYVMASHILNTTGLAIPTGVLTTELGILNYFMYIPKQNVKYTVPFKHPILQLFPLTDLPVSIECEYNLDKYEELSTIGISRPQFSGGFAFKK